MSVVMNGRGEREHICQNGNIYKMMSKCRDVFCVNVIA